jgi:hypothetical protein
MNKASERPVCQAYKKGDNRVYFSQSAKAAGTKKWREKHVLRLRNGNILEIGKKTT